MALPLQLRYALEGRPYGQALFFSVVCTALFFRLLARPRFATGLWYFLALIGGVYSAPYTLFLQLGYVSWAVLTRRWKASGFALAAFMLAAAAYLPWHSYSFRHWEAYDKANFTFSPKLLLLPLKEITEGGFVCSIPFLLLAWAGFRLASADRRSGNACLIAGAAAGLGFAFATDAAFGYFFAIRQVMFILVPLTLLAAQGFSSLLKQPGRAAISGLLAATLFSGSIVKDFHHFSDRSEDWGAGAAAIRSAMDSGACPKFITKEDAKLYGFFDASIQRSTCPALSPIVVASSRYTKLDDLQRLQRILSGQGYKAASTRNAGSSVLTVYRVTLSELRSPPNPL